MFPGQILRLAMIQIFINFIETFPPILGTLLMAMLTVVERLALPVAIAGFHLPVWEAFTLVILGNMVPVVLILMLAEKFHKWISAHDHFFSRGWIHSLDHAQKKFARYEKFGLIGLMLFLIVPTPVNGAFSASLIAFILGYPMHKSLPYLFAGVVLGNLVTLSLTLGAVKIF